jgi:hypothetical protein
MRSQLLTYLTANLTGTIGVSQELPFEEGNNPLYNRNMRRVYLDEPYTEMDTLIPTLGSTRINQKTTIVRLFLVVDAKNRNADLDAAITTFSSAKDITTIAGPFRREFDYTTTIDNDRITYEGQYRFYTIA